MSEAVEKIGEWANRTQEYRPVAWYRLPEIYLYMDQVLTYMNKQLEPLTRTEDAAPLTSSMINNYVKDGVLPRPEQKKYSREHLAMLTMICMLKPVLTIPDIDMLLKGLLEDNSSANMYERFCGAQSTALQDVCKRVAAALPEGEAALSRLAIELSIEAEARRTAAERILSELEAAQREKEH